MTYEQINGNWMTVYICYTCSGKVVRAYEYKHLAENAKKPALCSACAVRFTGDKP